MNREPETVVIFTDTHNDIPQSLRKHLGKRFDAKTVLVFRLDEKTCTTGRYTRGKLRLGRPDASRSKSVTLSVDAIQRILRGVLDAKKQFDIEWIVVASGLKRR